MVVFTSDNGPHHHECEDSPVYDGNFFESSAGLRGKKTTLWEGGTRVPLIVAWPGRVPAGAVSRVPAVLTDLAPTFLELAGVPGSGVPYNASDASASLVGVWTSPGTGADADAARDAKLLRPRGAFQLEVCRRPESDDSCATATYLVDEFPRKLHKLIKFEADAATRKERGEPNALELYELVGDPLETSDLAGDADAAPLVRRALEVRGTLRVSADRLRPG